MTSAFVTEKEFIEKIAPMIAFKGKKLKIMQAQQTYTILRDVGFCIINKEILIKRRKREANKMGSDLSNYCRISEIIGEE